MRSRKILCTTMLLAVACGTPRTPRIGIVLNADGVRGAVLAAADVNAAGGIRGQRLELRIIRGLSGTAARGALIAAESLATDPSILGIVGHSNSAASLAASQVYNEHHVVQIAPTSTAPRYSTAGPYSFRLVASDTHQGAFLAAIVAADSSKPRTALLYVNDDYGRALRGTFVQSLRTHGTDVVYEAPYEEEVGFADVALAARTIARSRADLVVWIGRSPALRELMPSLRAVMPAVRVLASDGFSDPDVELHPSNEVVGVRYVRFLDLGNRNTAQGRLAARFRAEWHDEYTDQYPFSYDAVLLLAEAIRASGTDRSAVREYLASLGSTRPAFQGISGLITFDAHGDPLPSYFLAEVTTLGSKPIPLPAGVRVMR